MRGTLWNIPCFSKVFPNGDTLLTKRAVPPTSESVIIFENRYKEANRNTGECLRLLPAHSARRQFAVQAFFHLTPTSSSATMRTLGRSEQENAAHEKPEAGLWSHLRQPGGHGEMRFTVELKPKAEKDLKAMPKDQSRGMYDAILALESGLNGDIKKLSDHWPEYRLRIGKWRALFGIEGNRIVVYRIRHRWEAYR